MTLNSNNTLKDNPEIFFKDGITFMKKNKTREAMLSFKRAIEINPSLPRYASYYGLCWAMTTANAKEPLLLCKRAVEKDLTRPDLLCNLGKVYLLRNKKRSAYRTFQRGLKLDPHNKDIMEELKKMGMRKAPAIPFLKRNNIINKFLGSLLDKSGLE